MKKINNNIQESYCSFEVSKLLKEKGMNIWSYAGWTDGKLATAFRSKIDLHRPTHALAIEWIRLNFDIHLSIDVGINGFYAHYKISPIGNIHSNVKQGWVNDESNPYSTPKEATETGLLYILTNLI